MMDFVTGYRAGLIGQVTALHALYYTREWAFGAKFEAAVAEGMAAYMQRYDAARDLTVSAVDAAGVQGSITLDVTGVEAPDAARIRWFIMSDLCRGKGIGRQLVTSCIQRAQSLAIRSVYLDTFAGLDAARALYEKAGFVLQSEEKTTIYGPEVIGQRFVLTLD